MNTIGAGVMDDIALAGLVVDVEALIGDTTTATSITWHPQGTRSWDPATGTVSYSGTTETLTGWYGPLSQREIANTQGARTGDVRVLLAASDVTPKVDDVFRIDTALYTVYALEDSPLSTHHVLYARKAVS